MRPVFKERLQIFYQNQHECLDTNVLFNDMELLISFKVFSRITGMYTVHIHIHARRSSMDILLTLIFHS